MKIIRITKKIKGGKKWPVTAVLKNGTRIRIPQQDSFNEFNQAHGCSMAAVAVALQFLGANKDPDEIYAWCRKNISGYTGSKLTISGAAKAINGITKKKAAHWHPITGTEKNRKAAIRRIRKAVKAGKPVLVEQASPIHTNIIIATRKGGVWVATNGTLKKATIPALVREALHGCAEKKEQDDWYHSGRRRHAAGYVIVDV